MRASQKARDDDRHRHRNLALDARIRAKFSHQSHAIEYGLLISHDLRDEGGGADGSRVCETIAPPPPPATHSEEPATYKQ